MPNYNPSPFKAPIKLLYAGVAEYLRGAWNQDKSPTQMYVTSVAIAGNVATLGVVVYGGDVPAVGALISTQGLPAAVAQFNVTNQVLTAVAVNSAGVGTVQFALAGANVATTAAAGMAMVPVQETPETVANGASVSVAMSNNSFGGDLDRTVTASANFTTVPTAASVVLQGSMFDDDAQFVTVGTIATVAGSAVTANGLVFTGKYLFYRALTSGASGTGTYTVKIGA